MAVDASIFKAYDIRGIVGKTLTDETVRAVGRILGAWTKQKGRTALCVGRDGRLSGPAFVEALSQGIMESGCDVIDVGQVPTPVLYFATHFFETGSGVAVTGSHNPPDYNGLKMMIDGVTLSGETIQAIREAIESGDWTPAEVPGTRREENVVPHYLSKILSETTLKRPMAIALDAGNGVAGPTAVELFERLGCTVTPLFTDIDGTFPNHHPDPSKPANLEDLKRVVREQNLEVGLAFDGDGDRLGVVTRSGEVIFPDRQLMLFARGILAQHPGAQIVYDVKCSRRLAEDVANHGGQPVISATGHSLVKKVLRETQAPLAGEMSGHIFFNDERWFGFDDGLYAGVRLLELLSATDDPSAELEALPNAVSTPELQIPVTPERCRRFLEALRTTEFAGATDVITIDGVRVEWADGFALARASNTTPVLVLRLEADTPDGLKRIGHDFAAALRAVEPNLDLPF